MISRTVAGLLLGYVLAAALGSLWTRALFGGDEVGLTLALVLYVPLWLAAWTWAYFAKTAWRAWWTLGFAALLLHGALALLPAANTNPTQDAPPTAAAV